MKRVVGPAVLMLAFLVAGMSPASAEVRQLGDNASSEQIIHALTPNAGAPKLKFRGIRLGTSEPAAASAAMPAVSLDIKFKLNSAELSEAAKETIKQLATAIRSPQLAKYHFRLEGHTDNTGTRAYNLALSERRAVAVRTYLIKTYGIAPGRLEAVGRGEAQPIDPADPANPANRRVQIVNTGE